MSRVPAAANGPSCAPHAPEFEVTLREGGITGDTLRGDGQPLRAAARHNRRGHTAQEVGRVAAREAWRIEAKFSRYRPESIVSVINRSQGHAVVVDEETAALLDYARQCYVLSEGRFDITSGVLRRCWRFDGSDQLPERAAVAALLPLIGFEKLRWDVPRITLPTGMEIDFGGIGKEYAVDCVLALVAARFAGAALVNFGGDLATNGAPGAGPWQVGVERPESEREPRLLLELSRGGLATSGDTHRFLLREGVRYGHILDPQSGWPLRDTPRSVTMAAASCVEAGMLATFAMLQGCGAQWFLKQQGVRYWCLRSITLPRCTHRRVMPKMRSV